MKRQISKLRAEDMKMAEEYWVMRKRYEAVFGKMSLSEVADKKLLAERISEMSDKLETYYQRQREGKRVSELVTA